MIIIFSALVWYFHVYNITELTKCWIKHFSSYPQCDHDDDVWRGLTTFLGGNWQDLQAEDDKGVIIQ